MSRTLALGLIVLAVSLLSPAAVAAQAKVVVRPDVVYLRDGTTVNGTVLLEGARAVIVLTDKGEVTLAMDQVERVVRSTGDKLPTVFPTTVKDGYIQIVPEPVDTTAPADGSAAPPAEPGVDMSVDVTKPSTPNATRVGPAAALTPNSPSDEAALQRLRELLQDAKNRDLLREFEAKPR